MLTVEENRQVEHAVRDLVSRPSTTPGEVAQLLLSLPARREAVDRALELVAASGWVGRSAFEQAVAHLRGIAGPTIPAGAPRRPASLLEPAAPRWWALRPGWGSSPGWGWAASS